MTVRYVAIIAPIERERERERERGGGGNDDV